MLLSVRITKQPMYLRRPTPVVYALSVAALLTAYQSLVVKSDGLLGRHYKVEVARVFDGDTFETTTGTRVRLLGVDSPEVRHGDSEGEPFGEESGAWLRGLILGREVMLQEGAERVDRYGRTLGWIYLEDGQLVNELTLSTGNSELMDRFGLPLELEPRLRAAEAKAKAEKTGLWRHR